MAHSAPMPVADPVTSTTLSFISCLLLGADVGADADERSHAGDPPRDRLVGPVEGGLRHRGPPAPVGAEGGHPGADLLAAVAAVALDRLLVEGEQGFEVAALEAVEHPGVPSAVDRAVRLAHRGDAALPGGLALPELGAVAEQEVAVPLVRARGVRRELRRP